MSRRQADSDAAYRVRTVQFNHRTERESVVVTRPYNTLSAARGEATRVKNQSRRATWIDTTVTVERATGWETV